jgi:hypothetical protein
VAEAARRELAQMRPHPAVAAAESLAEAGVERLFAAAFAGDWPADLAAHLASFRAEARLEHWRERAQADWDQALADLSAVLAHADLGGFLARRLGPGLPPITVFPNLLYPGLAPVTALTRNGWLLCLPPPAAWGTSPPWRYTERPDEVLATAAEALARAIFGQGQPEAQTNSQAALFGLAAAVLCLREAEGPEAADQFMLMEQRTRKRPGLPAVVRALEPCRGMAECAAAMRGAADGI